MSFRKSTLGDDPKTAKASADVATRRKANLFDNGMKAEYHSRSGAASYMDRDLYKKHLDDHDKALGDGSYTIKLMKPGTDDVAEGVPLNFGGRVYYPNAKNAYTIVDKDYLEVQLQKANEQEEYLNEVIELASASDKSLMTVLGINDMRTLKDLCGEKAKWGTQDNYLELPDSIEKVDCLPSVMRLYPKESLVFAQAVAKLRAIILAFAPIMDTAGTKKAVRENTD